MKRANIFGIGMDIPYPIAKLRSLTQCMLGNYFECFFVISRFFQNQVF